MGRFLSGLVNGLFQPLTAVVIGVAGFIGFSEKLFEIGTSTPSILGVGVVGLYFVSVVAYVLNGTHDWHTFKLHVDLTYEKDGSVRSKRTQELVPNRKGVTGYRILATGSAARFTDFSPENWTLVRRGKKHGSCPEPEKRDFKRPNGQEMRWFINNGSFLFSSAWYFLPRSFRKKRFHLGLSGSLTYTPEAFKDENEFYEVLCAGPTDELVVTVCVPPGETLTAHAWQMMDATVKPVDIENLENGVRASAYSLRKDEILRVEWRYCRA